MPKPRAPRDLADARFVRALDDDGAEIVTGEAVALDVQPAGVALRMAAALLDGLCQVLLWLGLVLGIGTVLPAGTDPAWGAVFAIGTVVVVLVGVPTAVETATRGRSVGRWATGTRVVRVDGGSIGFRQAFTRALVGVLELWASVGSIALVVALFGARPRRLGDLLAGTFVQYERAPKRVDPVVLMPPALLGWAAVADVSALPQQLENRLGQFFRGAASIRPEVRDATARALAEQVAPHVHPLPAVPAEELLAGVTVLRRERDLRALGNRAATLAGAAATAGARPPGFPR